MSIQCVCRHALRVALGLILTVAAAAKAFAFVPFAAAVHSLIGLGGNAATSVSAIVVAAELITGILLMTRRCMPAAAIVSFCMFVAFALVLTAAVVRRIEIPCMCFGQLVPGLPLRMEAALDLLLGIAALACIRGARPARAGGERLRAGTGISLGCTLIWGSALILWPDGGEGAHAGIPPPDGFFSGASALRGDYPAVLLIADFADFGCQLCLDDFLAFCDSLNGLAAGGVPRIRLVARRDSTRTIADQSRMLEGWASGNGYRFPVAVDTDSLFERSSAQKTSAIIWGKDGLLRDFARFPVGPGRRQALLRLLSD